MRLLNTTTLAITEFFGDVPPYAILSHTWGEEEVTFQDMISGQASELIGYRKIAGCCRQALADGLDFAWIDTCCIDKRSSSELSEAINSMFSWYRDSAVCYAYLQDCDGSDKSFRASRWFTRGWTLQELVAPGTVIFFASDWGLYGDRTELTDAIAYVTKIDRQFFQGGQLHTFSIAQKMSWASRRQTTRTEDQAYCLLGLFHVNMPLLYGEGSRAFVRLQEEIMKGSDDQSIFAWTRESEDIRDHVSQIVDGGLLATSPAQFADAGDIIGNVNDPESPPFSITNKGLQISLPIIEADSHYGVAWETPDDSTANRSGVRITVAPPGSLAILNCYSRKESRKLLAIVIERNTPDGVYERTNVYLGLFSIPIDDISTSATRQSVFIKAYAPPVSGFYRARHSDTRLISIEPLPRNIEAFRFSEVRPHVDVWRHANGCLSLHMPLKLDRMLSAALVFKEEGSKDKAFCIILKPLKSATNSTYVAVEASLVVSLKDLSGAAVEKLLPSEEEALPAKEEVYWQSTLEGSAGLAISEKQLQHATIVRLQVIKDSGWKYASQEYKTALPAIPRITIS